MYLLTPAILAGAVPRERFSKTVSRNRPLFPHTERNDYHRKVDNRFEPSRAFFYHTVKKGNGESFSKNTFGIRR